MPMRRRFFITSLALLISCTLAATTHAATATGLFTFKTIVSGSTTILDVTQSAAFPLGCPQLFIFTVGSGTLTITLQKDDISGDGIFMLGLAASGAGTLPIYRAGVSKGLITQSVPIGTGLQPYGFVWLYSGVAYSALTPAYAYTIELDFEP